MKRKPETIIPMSCPACTSCYARLDGAGRPTGTCHYGGPFGGFGRVVPTERTKP